MKIKIKRLIKIMLTLKQTSIKLNNNIQLYEPKTKKIVVKTYYHPYLPRFLISEQGFKYMKKKGYKIENCFKYKYYSEVPEFNEPCYYLCIDKDNKFLVDMVENLKEKSGPCLKIIEIPDVPFDVYRECEYEGGDIIYVHNSDEILYKSNK